MTFLEAQRAAGRGGHRLARAGHTPIDLYRMLVCERCGGKIPARSPDEAGGQIAVWSCTPRLWGDGVDQGALVLGLRAAAEPVRTVDTQPAGIRSLREHSDYHAEPER